LLAATLFTLGCNAVLGIEEAGPILGSGSGGSSATCSEDIDCEDDNPCSVTRCELGACASEPLDGDAPDTEQVPSDCKRARCTAGQLVIENDDTDLPSDGEDCTDDVCSNGTPGNPVVAAGTQCDGDQSGYCDGGGNCVECLNDDHCSTPETCAGAGRPGECGCAPVTCREVGLTCGNHPDDGCAGVLDCNNESQDGGETDVDCGGPVSTCPNRCNPGKACVTDTDCFPGPCTSLTCS